MKNQIIDLDKDPENADWLHQIRKRKEAKMIKFDEKYYTYLDDLRESGVCNMFGASIWLARDFPELDEARSRKILADWITTFAKRHPKKEKI